MGYGNFKGLNRTTSADEVLRDKAFNIAKSPRYDGYQRELASVVYRYIYFCLIRKLVVEQLKLKLCQIKN